MAYLVLFHAGWLAGALLIGLGMGWVSVVHRGRPLSPSMLGVVAAVVVAVVVLTLGRWIPGRFGYWIDLGLAMFLVYVVGCAVGSILRDWVIARHAAAK